MSTKLKKFGKFHKFALNIFWFHLVISNSAHCGAATVVRSYCVAVSVRPVFELNVAHSNQLWWSHYDEFLATRRKNSRSRDVNEHFPRGGYTRWRRFRLPVRLASVEFSSRSHVFNIIGILRGLTTNINFSGLGSRVLRFPIVARVFVLNNARPDFTPRDTSYTLLRSRRV